MSQNIKQRPNFGAPIELYLRYLRLCISHRDILRGQPGLVVRSGHKQQLAEGGVAEAHSHMVFRPVAEAWDNETLGILLAGAAVRNEQEAGFGSRQELKRAR